MEEVLNIALEPSAKDSPSEKEATQEKEAA
jgi:hypothetical protein